MRASPKRSPARRVFGPGAAGKGRGKKSGKGAQIEDKDIDGVLLPPGDYHVRMNPSCSVEPFITSLEELSRIKADRKSRAQRFSRIRQKYYEDGLRFLNSSSEEEEDKAVSSTKSCHCPNPARGDKNTSTLSGAVGKSNVVL